MMKTNKILQHPLLILFLFLSLTAGAQALDISSGVHNYDSLSDTDVNLSGKSELHLATTGNPLPGSTVSINSEDAWLFFEHIKPSVVIENHLPQVTVFGDEITPNENARVIPYINGTVIVPHSTAYQGLTVYSDADYSGLSMDINSYDYYRGTGLLGSMNNAISSFRLKRGYMATFAQEEDGTGISKVYVAQDADLEIFELPEALNDQVSFVRVIPWNWTNKKGFAGGGFDGTLALECGWSYDWDNAAVSPVDAEYIPMRHNANWNNYENINVKVGSTHVLGFNEPDRPDQADMTVDEVLEQWPQLLASGLRLGAPAVSDGGLNWLYRFIDRADELNYRVDFVPVHFYQANHTAESFRAWLKRIHDRVGGRPLWITEWNNGANWTCCEPTFEEQKKTIGEFIDMLDSTPFVERYSLYNWVGETRKLISNFDPMTLTPAGEVYRDQRSPLAYSDPGGLPATPTALQASAVSSRAIELSWSDTATNESTYTVERRHCDHGCGEWEVIATLPADTSRYNDDRLASASRYAYRVRAHNSVGESLYSNKAHNTTHKGIGILSQEDWSLVFVDSEEPFGNGLAVNAFDNNPSTIWHSEWRDNQPKPPHEIQIDLGASYEVGGFLYLPRQDGNLNGTITEYEFYVSDDAENWGTPVSTGTWANNAEEKEANFPIITGRYIRLIGLAEQASGSKSFSSAAEISVLVNSCSK